MESVGVKYLSAHNLKQQFLITTLTLDNKDQSQLQIQRTQVNLRFRTLTIKLDLALSWFKVKTVRFEGETSFYHIQV